MSITTVTIRGADGTEYEVVGDLIGTDFYPIYKLSIGAVGTDDLPVSSSNPMPVQVVSGTDSIGVVGEGDTVDRVDSDGTAGQTKGSLSFGVDLRNEARPMRTNPQGDSMVYLTEDTGQAILKQMRIANFHLALLSGAGTELGDV